MLLTFFHILFTVILPIFILIFIGVVFDRAFKPDMDTLSKLNFYVFVPAIVFIKIIDAQIALTEMGIVGIFNLAHFFIIFGVASLIFSLKRFRENRTTLSMASAWYNAGNYGIPLIVFAFGDAYMDIIAVVLLVQNLLTFSFGLWLMERGSKPLKEILKGLLKVPVIYAVLFGILLKAFELDVIPQIKEPLNYLSDGVIPIALVTLGAKLSRIKLSKDFTRVLIVIIIRLAVSPVVAILLIIAFPITGVEAAVVIVLSGTPVAVNIYVLAEEYKKGQDLASQAVFWTTIMSVVSISLLLSFFG
ncbi:MAG: AEC family transporter [Candidatus Hodarchaeota archaeon]